MDANRFEIVTRTLQGRQSRRGALVAVLGGALEIAFLRADSASAKTKKPCPPCKKRKKGKCKGALPDGTSCDGGICLGGRCLAGDPPPPAACGAGGVCLVFLSSTLHTGNLGGLGGADGICQNLATVAGLPGTYKAWLSDATGAVSSRFVPHRGPYQLVNGTQIATSFADLTDGTLLAAITVTETGGDHGGFPAAWTATSPNGQIASDVTCTNWTSGAQTGQALVGIVTRTDAEWTESSNTSCSSSGHLYCFQQR